MEKREQDGLSIERSLEMFKEAERLIPGGAQLLNRRPGQFAYGVSPIFAERAKGTCFWDIDGGKVNKPISLNKERISKNMEYLKCRFKVTKRVY